MEAQRYPEDFDGILAGSPALQLTGLAIEQNWSLRKFYDNNFAGNIFGKTNAVTAAAKAACADPEGVFSNPACTYDPTALACPAGVDNASCMTPPQLTAVKEVYRGPHSSTGTPWYPGKPIGSEASWPLWIVGNSATPSTWNPLQGGFGFSFVNNLFFEVDPPSTYNWYDLNFDVDPFARLFVVHGMDHCDAADRGGLTVADWMAPLVSWVEKGQAPDSIPGKSRATNPTVFTRPICAYPTIATYTGTGSRLDAANWSCTL
jgi:feruloyl esterase